MLNSLLDSTAGFLSYPSLRTQPSPRQTGIIALTCKLKKKQRQQRDFKGFGASKQPSRPSSNDWNEIRQSQSALSLDNLTIQDLSRRFSELQTHFQHALALPAVPFFASV